MATVNVVLAYRGNEYVPVAQSRANHSESLSSSGTALATTIVAEADEYWIVTPLGDVWVHFHPTEDAAVATTYLVPGGATAVFQAIIGDKCSVVDAT